jgi:TonB family protein
MRTLLTISSILFFFLNTFSQNDKIIYFDDNWVVTDSSDAKYYRTIENYTVKQKLYKITDRYMTGTKYMEGFSKLKRMEGFSESISEFNKTGNFIYYYKDGSKWGQANFKNNKCDGIRERWYPNGKLLDKRKDYKHSIKINEAWDSTGKQIASNGNGFCYDLNENGKIVEKSEISEGNKQGKCLGYTDDGALYYEEEYEKGKLVKGVSYDSLKIEHEYNVWYETASFQGGGLQSFRAYVEEHLSYPENLGFFGIEGRVFIGFDVLASGKVANIRLLMSSGHKEFDQMAFFPIASSPLWIPATRRGIAIRQRFVIPISFKACPANCK